MVSGANRGIGLEVCRQLAERGYTVVLGSRDLAKGEAAARWMEPFGLLVAQLAYEMEPAPEPGYRFLRP